MKDLKNLREVTNQILLKAIKEKEKIGGDVNWGDLSCSEVFLCVREDGSEFYRVIIEEAAPDACELQEYVEFELFQRGFKDVEVTTEW